MPCVCAIAMDRARSGAGARGITGVAQPKGLKKRERRRRIRSFPPIKRTYVHTVLGGTKLNTTLCLCRTRPTPLGMLCMYLTRCMYALCTLFRCHEKEAKGKRDDQTEGYKSNPITTNRNGTKRNEMQRQNSSTVANKKIEEKSLSIRLSINRFPVQTQMLVTCRPKKELEKKRGFPYE